ncbi:alkaline phosphatase family protein [Solwaraspora sp. WMMD1047]|uniref:alkaline phosphatase family protein n=1 Tax=Solwaraspora sp. WMMD1047 TaxID=3016102 RepID=UPI0024163AEB|nr:nucleotide pyrophosphatase/phosphodiesterase family protein [Solwaraspora sp. WMMD1047]MDG4832168.1 alkaline phosphatase family protein [Solwaraspora sp. WMMD1047]
MSVADLSRWSTGPAPFDVVAPRYGTASLADLLPSALAVLGVPGATDRLGLTDRLDGVRRLAVLLVDGLGWYQIPVAAPHAPTLADLAVATGTPLTAGFPSTTPTSLVSLGTGAAPGAHGVLGFKLNVPGTDRVLNHTNWRGSADGPDPRRWQPLPTQLERAAAAGVTVTVVSRPEYAGSGLTAAANSGGTYRGAAGVDVLAAEMLAALAAGDGPTLVSGYHPDLDQQGHLSGVDSAAWRLAARDVDRLLRRLVAGLPADAALLVTADHGQLNVPPGHRFDLDADPRLRAGVRLVAGEPRVRYLHVQPGAAADVVATWSAVLGEAAWVASRAEAVAAGWFGPVPEEHLARVGDVVVVCNGSYAVLATATDSQVESRLIAYHGSWTATEMTIPLLVVRG